MKYKIVELKYKTIKNYQNLLKLSKLLKTVKTIKTVLLTCDRVPTCLPSFLRYRFPFLDIFLHKKRTLIKGFLQNRLLTYQLPPHQAHLHLPLLLVFSPDISMYASAHHPLHISVAPTFALCKNNG